MKKGCIIATIIIACVFVFFGGILGLIGLGIYRGVKNIPPYANREVVYKDYAEFLAAIDQAKQESTSQLDLAARLEKIEMPPELLFMGLQTENDSVSDVSIEIVKNIDWSSKSTMIINGAGYGKLDGNEILIIEYNIDKYKIEDCIIFLRPPTESSASDTE